MKTLCLIRHAKSSWSDPSLSDFDRPLNKRGKRDAPFMGQRLRQTGIQPELIVSSPARRARKTARMLAREIDYDVQAIDYRDEIYSGDRAELIEIVRATASAIQTMILIGHNFVITDCAEKLTGERIVSIPTCGIVSINFNCQGWMEVSAANSRLVFFDYPKLHKGRSKGG